MGGADPLALAVRFGLYFILGVGFGVPLFTLYTPHGDRKALRPTLVGSAIAGAVLSIAGIVLLAASMAGVDVAAVDAAAVRAILALPGIGTAWIIRMVALLSLVVAAIAIRGQRRLAVIGTAAAGTALASLAWTGHGNISGGFWAPVHLGADIVHLLAAGAWLGALLALLALVGRPAHRVSGDHVAQTHVALAGFSIIGSVMCGLIVVSGLVNSWTVIGLDNLGTLFTTIYGWLFISKLTLFTVMLGLAAANRFGLTPALERAAGDPSRQMQALRTSLLVETSAAILILALVAWLGLLAPPGSMG